MTDDKTKDGHLAEVCGLWMLSSFKKGFETPYNTHTITDQHNLDIFFKRNTPHESTFYLLTYLLTYLHRLVALINFSRLLVRNN